MDEEEDEGSAMMQLRLARILSNTTGRRMNNSRIIESAVIRHGALQTNKVNQ